MTLIFMCCTIQVFEVTPQVVIGTGCSGNTPINRAEIVIVTYSKTPYGSFVNSELWNGYSSSIDVDEYDYTRKITSYKIVY